MKPKLHGPDYHSWRFKALWRSTAKVYIIPGKNYADALKRVENMILRELGGRECLEIKFLSQES